MGAGEIRGGEEDGRGKAKEIGDGVRKGLSAESFFVLLRYWADWICVPPGIS